MACIPIPGGIACGVRRRYCKTPGCRNPLVAECDWKLHKVVDGKRVYTGKTCDAGMCEQHRGRVDAERDLCPPHMKIAREHGWVPDGG